MPEYELYSYEELSDALSDMREQIKAGASPLVWKGPDRLHYSLLATNFCPSEAFSPEKLEYEADQGRDVWDVYTHVAFMLGWHQAVVQREKRDKYYEDLDAKLAALDQ